MGRHSLVEQRPDPHRLGIGTVPGDTSQEVGTTTDDSNEPSEATDAGGGATASHVVRVAVRSAIHLFECVEGLCFLGVVAVTRVDPRDNSRLSS